MGNSLHNKIYLGRRARAFNVKGMAALVVLATVAGGGFLWVLARALK